MNSVSHRLDLRILIAPIALLCLLFATVIIQVNATSEVSGKAPSVELRAARTLITYPCPPCMHSIAGTCPTEFEPRIELSATPAGFNQHVVYSYAVTGGQIVGEGSRVTWDLSYCGPGNYTATVEARDKKHRADASTNVIMSNCGDCVDGDCHCPAIVVNCYDMVKAGTPINCKAIVVGARSPSTLEWTARTANGEGLSERIKRVGEYISIPTSDLAGRIVQVTVEVKGLDLSCNSTAAGSIVVKP